jgi:flagellar capping protein FliD
MIDRMTDASTGALQSRLDAIDRQIENNKDRIEQLTDQIEAKRQRYEAEFAALETMLADMQAQSQSLSGIQMISGGAGSVLPGL